MAERNLFGDRTAIASGVSDTTTAAPDSVELLVIDTGTLQSLLAHAAAEPGNRQRDGSELAFERARG